MFIGHVQSSLCLHYVFFWVVPRRLNYICRRFGTHVVTYGCEAWTLTTRDEQHLRIFERKILKKILGSVQDKDGSWRIRMNHELNEFIENADIVRGG